MGRILVALGGNALQVARGHGTWTEMRTTFRTVVASLAGVVEAGHELVLTHGNGPQVGRLLRQNELAEPEVPALPLDVLGAETQGQIGYLIQEELSPELRARGVERSVLSLISRMEVDPNDPAFGRPTKPVGRYYRPEEAEALRRRLGWVLAEDPQHRGWRRLVPSPRPVRWLEGHVVRTLLDAGLGSRWIPAVCGGGGVPVVPGPEGTFRGVEAVIDKDLAGALVAKALSATAFAIVTDVPGVALGFGRPDPRWLGEVSVADLESHLERGEFPDGSMGPKVEAAIAFARSGAGPAVITDIASLGPALAGRAGTRVRPEP